ncbi:MAG: hypothetical protein KC619_25800 [Myxococcales bacterium]|nr:hypothetical protein [Myxococcales bacterium]
MSARSLVPAVVLALLAACGSRPEAAAGAPASPAPTAADERPPAAPRTEGGPAEEPATRALAPYPEPWEGTVALAGPAPETHRRFVVSPRSAICPTREQAERRECGHSVEFVTEGLRLVRGDSVLVVGTEPFDGHWRAVRDQLEGTLPSWIRADDLADRPDESGIAAFDARPDVAAARPVDAMNAEAIAALDSATVVRWSRKQGITLAGSGSIGERHRSLFVYVPTPRGVVAVAVLEDQERDELWAYHHQSLTWAGGLSLDYLCEPDVYCDGVSITGFVTPLRTPPPEDPEGEWPAQWTHHMPIVVATAMADRFGTYELEVPDWAQAWAPAPR